MEGIEPFQSGRPLLSEVTADKLNRILAEIKRNRPVVAAPLMSRVTGDGTHISINKATRGTGTLTTSHPFQIKSFPKPADNDEETDTYIVTVLPGTINSLLPDDIFDGETIKQHEIPKDALRFVILDAETNGKQITAARVELLAAAASPQEPQPFGLPVTAQFLIGAVYNSSVYQVINTNVTVAAKQQAVISKTSPAEPGELPYEIYYVWG
jgi:hypothetical protein